MHDTIFILNRFSTMAVTNFKNLIKKTFKTANILILLK